MNFSLVCHDAGAANLIQSWIKYQGINSSFKCYLEGPARIIWQNTFPNHNICESLDECLNSSSILLSGTGWQSDLEFNAIVKARSMGLKTIAVLDHWVNYLERFQRRGQSIYPDELWVFDKHAAKLARSLFPFIPTKVQRNYYLADLISKINPLNDLEHQDVLYVLEPIRSKWPINKEGEFEALDFFISQLKCLNIPVGSRIFLRPHPSDFIGKYNEWIFLHQEFNVFLDESTSLSEAISKAKFVVGCETYALVVALSSGRKVYCSLPPWAPPSRLPFDEIVRISEMIS